ncbi:MAG: hypothetical protein OEY94_10025 [Alphaproteobacteria bacterium]|nr:hypothetical protein [Alphaproteobacteria bacterium]
MPETINPEILNNLAYSIADHSWIKHNHEFRNEKPDGTPRSSSPRKSYGDRLEIHNRGDLADHIKETIQSSDTKYFIDHFPGVDGRLVFFNKKIGITIIFDPHQLWDGDGHAGSVFREKICDRGTIFNKELRLTTDHMDHPPKIRSALDGTWKLVPEVFKSPIGRSAAYARVNPPL